MFQIRFPAIFYPARRIKVMTNPWTSFSSMRTFPYAAAHRRLVFVVLYFTSSTLPFSTDVDTGCITRHVASPQTYGDDTDPRNNPHTQNVLRSPCGIYIHKLYALLASSHIDTTLQSWRTLLNSWSHLTWASSASNSFTYSLNSLEYQLARYSQGVVMVQYLCTTFFASVARLVRS